MLSRYLKLYVVPCGKSYVFTRLEIVCCYDIGKRMLYHVGSRMFLRNRMLFNNGSGVFVRYWKLYVCMVLEVVFLYDLGSCKFVQFRKLYVCTMLEVVCLYDVANRMLL